MKRISIIVLSITLAGLILASCTAFSPSRYAAEMTAVLHDFDAWYSGDLATYRDLLSMKTRMDATLTYGDLVMGTVYAYRVGKGIAPEKNWNAIDKQLFQNTLQMMHDSGAEVLAQIKKIAAPSEIRDEHAQLQNCLQYQKDISESMLSIFTRGTFVEIETEYTSNPCMDVEVSFTLVNAYVAENLEK